MSASWILTAVSFAAAVLGIVTIAWRWRGRRGAVWALAAILPVVAVHMLRTRQTFLLTEWLLIAGVLCVGELFRPRNRAKRAAMATVAVAAGWLLIGQYREFRRLELVRAGRCPLVGTQIWTTSEAVHVESAERETPGSGFVRVQVWNDDESVRFALARRRQAEASGNVTKAAASLKGTPWDELSPTERSARGLLVLAHRDVAENFAANAGFGFNRMTPQMQWPDLYLPGTCPAPMENDASPAGDALPTGDSRRAADFARSETDVRFETGDMSATNETAVVPPGSRRWIAERVQLISLLQHWTAVAYDIPRLPTMRETEEAPTRPLDEFERAGLSRLGRGEEVVLETSDDRIRMIGSLRATSSACTRCHRVSEGTLLGAITYDIVPAETPDSVR